MEYYKTYHFANICNAIMEDSFQYLRILNDFWGEGNIEFFFKPFQKYSALHKYIEFCIDRLFYESNKDLSELKIDGMKNRTFWINEALAYHNIEHPSFWQWYTNGNEESGHLEDLINKYLQNIEFSDFYMSLKTQMVEETFFVLFLNRKFLRKFNLNLAGIFEVQGDMDYEMSSLMLLNDRGKLRRKRIPAWAKKAVFYRDRGKCTYCQKDLTGLINISNLYHIDHIVPLNKYGFNDVSNLQLLCDNCNSSKGSRHAIVSKDYEKWY